MANLFKRMFLKKSLKSLNKKIEVAKNTTYNPKNEKVYNKNYAKLKDKYIKTIMELEEFFEIEGSIENKSVEELDKILIDMQQKLCEEFKIKYEDVI